MITCVSLSPCLFRCVFLGSEMEFGTQEKAQAGFWQPGIGGIDVARSVQLLDGDSRVVLFAGGANGDLLLGELASLSLSTLAVPTAAPTRLGLYLFEREARKGWRSVLEPEPRVSGEECRCMLEAVHSVLAQTDWLCVAGPTSGEAGDFLPGELTRLARQGGVRVLLAVRGPALRECLAVGPDVLALSRGEAARIFGSQGEPEELFRDLRRAGGRTLILTDGPGPVRVFHDRKRLVIEPPAIHPLNPTTAGESLVAGFLEALEEGWEIESALVFAVGAGACDASRLFPCGVDRQSVESSMRLVRVRE